MSINNEIHDTTDTYVLFLSNHTSNLWQPFILTKEIMGLIAIRFH